MLIKVSSIDIKIAITSFKELKFNSISLKQIVMFWNPSFVEHFIITENFNLLLEFVESIIDCWSLVILKLLLLFL